MDSGTPVSRRAVAKGAAWSVPVIAVAAAAPAMAASPPEPLPNDQADYYWRGPQGMYVTLAPGKPNAVHFDGDIGYRGGYPAPTNPTLIITVQFSAAVTIPSTLPYGWVVDSTGPAESFVFKLTPASQGGHLTFGATAEEQQDSLTVTAKVSMDNTQRSDGSYATWTNAVGQNSSVTGSG